MSRSRPGFSGAAGSRDPEAVLGASIHHVGECCFLLVAICRIVAIGTNMAAGAMSPTVVLDVFGFLGFFAFIAIFAVVGGVGGLVVNLGFKLHENVEHAKLAGIGCCNICLVSGWGRRSNKSGWDSTGIVAGVSVSISWRNNSSVQVVEEGLDCIDT